VAGFFLLFSFTTGHFCMCMLSKSNSWLSFLWLRFNSWSLFFSVVIFVVFILYLLLPCHRLMSSMTSHMLHVISWIEYFTNSLKCMHWANKFSSVIISWCRTTCIILSLTKNSFIGTFWYVEKPVNWAYFLAYPSIHQDKVLNHSTIVVYRNLT